MTLRGPEGRFQKSFRGPILYKMYCDGGQCLYPARGGTIHFPSFAWLGTLCDVTKSPDKPPCFCPPSKHVSVAWITEGCKRRAKYGAILRVIYRLVWKFVTRCQAAQQPRPGWKVKGLEMKATLLCLIITEFCPFLTRPHHNSTETVACQRWRCVFSTFWNSEIWT